MVYQLFTYPNCHKCADVKKYLKEKKIDYKEINAGLGEGKKIFQEFYVKNRDIIKREENGTISLPILIEDGKIFQGLEGILNKAI